MMKPVALAPATVLAVASPSAAQDQSEDIRVRVGLGAQLRPEFIGADKRDLGPLVDIDIARGSNPFQFEAPDDVFAIPVISSSSFSAGPAGNIEARRRRSDVGADVDRVKTTFEVGAFAQVLPLESIRIRGDLRKGINGHEGVVGAVSLDHVWRDGDRYVFSVGPRLLFSSARYQRAYFGVSPTASSATGLSEYERDGGVHAIGVASGMSTQLSGRLGVFSYGRFERLVGDAAKSPIVREFGSRNQLSAGLG
jgi:outer membrane protein